MPQQKIEYLALLSSPGGLDSDKEAVKIAVSEVNTLMQHERVSVLIKDWRVDLTPGRGSDPQSLINSQIVDSADIVIALVHTRMGTPTSRASSGTVEEVERFIERHERGESVGIFVAFKKESVDPDTIDIDQLSKVREFKKKISAMGVIYIEYEDIPGLSKDIRTRLPEVVRGLVGVEKYSNKEKTSNIVVSNARSFWSEEDDELFDEDLSDGSLDFQVNFEDGVSGLTNGMSRMTSASESFQRDIQNALDKAGSNSENLSTKEKQSVVNSVAKVLERFSDDLEISLADMRVGQNIAAGALSGMMDHFGEDVSITPDSINDFANSILDAKLGIDSAIPSVSTARESVAAFPRLTRELAKARGRTVKLLDGVIALLTQMSEWFAASAAEILERYVDGPDETRPALGE